MARQGAAIAFLAALALALPRCGGAQRLDDLPRTANGSSTVSDAQLQQLLRISASWLESMAGQGNRTLVHGYTDQLQAVLEPSCSHCFDYFEAVARVKALGKAVKALLEGGGVDSVVSPVVRRSYVAAVWLLQRTRMFAWGATHLQSNALATMFRLYMHHVRRAKGRTISFHHLSKCGGTTMCQLAAANKCANPHLTMEKNCVIDDRMDGPLWMVSHDVDAEGAVPDPVHGRLDVVPPSPYNALDYNRNTFDVEPPLPMWLMYSCPHQLSGRMYNCRARAMAAQQMGTSFLANERALSREPGGNPQLCPQFLNAITLRQPVPHVISLLAEVRWRYARQLSLRNISSWAPPGWNLTWWETLGPSLVGNYATRSLVGRDSFCRSAVNMSAADLDAAVDALLGFDVVMTLDRPGDIDLLVSAMFGWPARNFTATPARRVRNALAGPVVLTFPVAMPAAAGTAPATQKHRRPAERPASWAGRLAARLRAAWPARGGSRDDDEAVGGGGGRVLLSEAPDGGGVGSSWGDSEGDAASGSYSSESSDGSKWSSDGGDDDGRWDSSSSSGGNSGRGDEEDGDGGGGGDPSDEGADSTDRFDAAAAFVDSPFADPPPAPPLPPEVLAADASRLLVRNSWREREARRLGFHNASAAAASLRRMPEFRATGEHSLHGAVVVEVVPAGAARGANASGELWHAFPGHSVAMPAAEVARLEQLTALDGRLFGLAQLLLDLDAAWLQAMLASHHYRKRLRAVADTYAACGFAGIIAVDGRTSQQQLWA